MEVITMSTNLTDIVPALLPSGDMAIPASVSGDYKLSNGLWCNTVAPIGGIDAYTVLMLHMQDTGLADSSLSPVAIANNGNVVRSSDQHKLGGYSGFFNGSGGQLNTPVSTAFQLGDIWTIETWLYPTSYNASYNQIYSSADGNGWFQMFLNGSGQVKIADNVHNEQTYTGGSFPLNQWSHLAFTRTLPWWGTVYINGNSIGHLDCTFPSTASYVAYIGTDGDRTFNGYMSEFRVSKGIARWSSNFVPNIVPYN